MSRALRTQVAAYGVGDDAAVTVALYPSLVDVMNDAGTWPGFMAPSNYTNLPQGYFNDCPGTFYSPPRTTYPVSC